MCEWTWARKVELKELKISFNSIIVDQGFLITLSIFTSLHMMLEAYTKRLMDHGEGVFFFSMFCIFCVKTFLSFLFHTFLFSHSKQALTPKIVTLICLVIE